VRRRSDRVQGVGTSQRPARTLDPHWPGVVPREQPDPGVCPAQLGIGDRVVRVELDCFFEHSQGDRADYHRRRVAIDIARGRPGTPFHHHPRPHNAYDFGVGSAVSAFTAMACQ
jgi:hypothetical protein